MSSDFSSKKTLLLFMQVIYKFIQECLSVEGQPSVCHEVPGVGVQAWEGSPSEQVVWTGPDLSHREPPEPNRQTDRIKHINFPQTSYAGRKYMHGFCICLRDMSRASKYSSCTDGPPSPKWCNINTFLQLNNILCYWVRMFSRTPKQPWVFTCSFSCTLTDF